MSKKEKNLSDIQTFFGEHTSSSTISVERKKEIFNFEENLISFVESCDCQVFEMSTHSNEIVVVLAFAEIILADESLTKFTELVSISNVLIENLANNNVGLRISI